MLKSSKDAAWLAANFSLIEKLYFLFKFFLPFRIAPCSLYKNDHPVPLPPPFIARGGPETMLVVCVAGMPTSASTGILGWASSGKAVFARVFYRKTGRPRERQFIFKEEERKIFGMRNVRNITETHIGHALCVTDFAYRPVRRFKLCSLMACHQVSNMPKSHLLVGLHLFFVLWKMPEKGSALFCPTSLWRPRI